MTLKSYQYDPRDTYGRRPTAVVKKSRWRRLGGGLSLKRVTVTLAIIILLLGGWLGGKFIYNAHKLFGGNILGVLSSTKLKGEDSGRVNILLAGNSADDPGHNGANLTDSIMVMSIDTRNHKAFLLSVPRDLWVHIPGDGHSKINAAYVAGKDQETTLNGYSDSGMAMLSEIVQQDMGLTINYYALIDYNALKQAVDAVGGIDVTIKSNDPRGLYDPNIDYATHGPLVKLTNGVHHLNGEQALDLARARGDSYYSYGFAGSDFDRTEHQRQMIVALKEKAVSAGVLANPAKLSSLSDAIGNNVKTNFSLGEVHRLYDIVKDIPSNSIQSLSLNSANGKNLLASYRSSTGESALVPAAGIDNYSAIQGFIKKQTSNDPVVQEGASVIVLNATDTSGLAGKEKNRLTAKNLIVSSVGDARTNQSTTTVINNSQGKKPATLALLSQLYNNQVTTTNPYSGIYSADFIVLVGSDRITPASTNSAQ